MIAAVKTDGSYAYIAPSLLSPDARLVPFAVQIVCPGHELAMQMSGMLAPSGPGCLGEDFLY
jgi:hypothetical protein